MASVIELSSLPPSDFLTRLSRELNADFEAKHESYLLYLPKHIGAGSIKGVAFSNGLWITSYRCSFNETTDLRYSLAEIQPLEFVYCAKGSLLQRFSEEEDFKRIEQNQNVIMAAKSKLGTVLRFEAGHKLNAIVLGIDRKRFNKKINGRLNSLDNRLQDVFDDVMGSSSFYHAGYYNLLLADILAEINDFQHHGIEKRLFLEAKSYEMLAHQIWQYNKDVKHTKSKIPFAEIKTTQVEEATEYIHSNIRQLDKVGEIAKRVGVNPNKLQQGFRVIHGTTLGEYVKKYRLSIARQMLFHTDKPIADIVDEVGFSSGSYFSKVFRESYSVTPREIRKMIRSKSNS